MTSIFRKAIFVPAIALVLLMASQSHASLTIVSTSPSEPSLYSSADTHLLLLSGQSGTSNAGTVAGTIMDTLYGSTGLFYQRVSD